MKNKVKELKELSLKLTSDIWAGIEAFESSKIKDNEILGHLNVCLTKYFNESKEVIKKTSLSIETPSSDNDNNSWLLNDLDVFKNRIKVFKGTNAFSDSMNCNVRNDSFICLNCGNQLKISLPIKYDKCNVIFDEFIDLHKNCKKTFEDKVDASLPPHLKAQWWLQNGEKNSSSKTMYQVLSGLDIGLKRHEYTHPNTVDDFKLCYELVKTIPEWAALLNRLSIISPVWKKIVDNWDRICLMVDNQKTQVEFIEIHRLLKSFGC